MVGMFSDYMRTYRRGTRISVSSELNLDPEIEELKFVVKRPFYDLFRSSFFCLSYSCTSCTIVRIISRPSNGN